jgi:hypothetical protein
MVSIDNKDGLVTLRFHEPYEEGDEAKYLAALARIEALDESFVMLSIIGAGGHFSDHGEREQALWFKRSRPKMNRLCRVMAVVRPHVSEHMRSVFTRLWEFPVLVTTCESEAEAFLAPHLQRAS